MDQVDDLNAFERRMIEIVSSIQPVVWRWRLLLSFLILTTLLTFSTLIWAVPTNYLSFVSLVYRRDIGFCLSFSLLIIAVLAGAHRKIFARSVILARSRDVLADYNISCDSRGRLILKTRLAI